jgi:hypothetical protein
LEFIIRLLRWSRHGHVPYLAVIGSSEAAPDRFHDR